MFNSKAFCIILFITMLAVGATAAFQFLEMQDFGLVEQIKNEYFGGNKAAETAKAPAAKKDAKK